MPWTFFGGYKIIHITTYIRIYKKLLRMDQNTLEYI